MQTPSYMAPELFEGAYSETVDVYSFGMCVLEMVSKRMPYDECSNPAQLYRKVSSGVLPDAFHGIRHPSVQAFIRFCVQRRPDGRRPSAAEVEAHPFLNEEAPEDDDDDLMIPGEGGRVGGGAGPGAAGAGGAATSRRKMARGSSIGEAAAVSATPAAGGGDAGGSPPRVDTSPPAAASSATHFATSDVYSGGGPTVAQHVERSPRRSSVSSDGDSGVGSGGDDMPGWEASPALPATEQQQEQQQPLLSAPVDDDTPPASVARSDPPVTLSDLPVAIAAASTAAVAAAPPLVDLCSVYDLPPPTTTVGQVGHRRLSDALGLAADLPAAVEATSSPAVSALRDSPLAAAAVSRTARASVASVRLQLTQRGPESASPLIPVGSSREFVSTGGGGASHGSLQSMRGAMARRSLSHSSPPSAALLASVIAPSAAIPMSSSPATTPLGDAGMLFLCLEILHVQDDGNSAQATVTFGLDVTSNEVECAVEIVRSLRGLSLHVDDDTCVPMLAAFLNAQRAAPQVTITTGPIAKFNWQSLVLRQAVPEAQGDATSATADGPNTASAPAAASVRDAPGPPWPAHASHETQGDDQPQRLLDGTSAPLPPGPISELVLDEGFGSASAESAASVAARDATPGYALYGDGSTATGAAYARPQRGALSDDVAGAAAGLVDEAPDAEFVASLGAERRQQLSQLGSVVLSGDEFAGSEGRRISSASQLSLAESLSRADDSDSGHRPSAHMRRASMRHDSHRDRIGGPGELSDLPYDEMPTTITYPDATGVTSLYASDALSSMEPNTLAAADEASLGDFHAYERAEGVDASDSATIDLLGAGGAYALGTAGGGASSALDLDDYGHDSSASFVAGLAEAYALTARAGQGDSFDGAVGARVGSSTGYLPAEYAIAGGPAEEDVGADSGAIADSSRAEFHEWDPRLLATSSSITTGREFSDGSEGSTTAVVHENSFFPSRDEGGSAAAVFASPGLAPAPAGGSYSAAPTPARIAAAFGDGARLDDVEDAGDVLSNAGASLFSPSEAVAPAEGVLFSPVIAGTVGRGAASIVASDARH